MKRNITLIIALMATMLTGIANAQTSKLSELTIIDKVEVSLTAPEARHENTAQRVTVDMTEALAKLGGGGLGMALHKFYIAQYDEQTEGKTDELTSDYNYRKGWWLTGIYDENIGEITGECVADTNHASVMYIHDVELDDKQLSMIVGQVGKATIPGNTYFALLYYINGSNAIEITVKLTITEATLPELAEMTKVGERDASVSMYYNSSYKYRVVNFNADSLYDAIYAQIPQPNSIDYEEGLYWGQGMKLVLYAQSAENTLTDDASANYGGFWLNTDGLACEWGAAGCAIFCEPDYDTGLSDIHVGIFPDYSLIDTSVKTTLYIVGDNFYYQLNLKVNITTQPTLAECELMGTQLYTVELIPEKNGTEGLIQADYMKDMIDLRELITNTFESDNLIFATYTYIPGQGYGPMPSGTNINNTPIANVAQYGYQMTDISFFAEMMGDESMRHLAVPMSPNPPLSIAYGICYNDSTLSFWQPDGVREVGDYYSAEYYLYSLDDKKKVKLNINVVYVSERNPVEIIGSSYIELASRNTETNDYAATKYDLSEVLETLGCDDAGKIVWMAYNNLYQLIAPADYDELAGFVFSSNGCLLPEDLNGAIFVVGYVDGEFHSLVMNPSDDSEHTTAIVATYNGKGYQFNIKVTPTPDTGIRSLTPTLSQGEGVWYDLTGRQIVNRKFVNGKLPKGIYIINGKKVLFK